MTSQKRYRHHQENHSARYRDLPPRFKRQKSSSSPPPPPVSSSDNILQEISSPISESNKQVSTDMTSNPVYFNEANRNDSNENFNQAKTPTVPTNSLKWSALPKKELPVLSSVDNQFFNFAPAVHIPLGTQFGYSPPLSPWNMGNMSVYTGQTTALHKSDPWTSAETYVNQRLLSPAKINYNNENNVPPVSPWNKSYSPQLPSNLSSPLTPIQKNTSLINNQQTITREITPKPNVDYSDPDIRTIEMLRELERVADEKQNDDFGVDRKSLVSHHLRMLMCAVDRYTEGIEDELSRNDEVVNVKEQPAYTPRLDSHPPYFAKQNTHTVPTMWPKDDVNIDTQKGGSSKQFASSWMHEPKMESSSVNPTNDQKKEVLLSEQGASCVPPGTWDLWSSPSFDICDVLSHPLPCNLSESELPHFDMFGSYSRGDSFNIEEVRPRKPLYKR